MGNLLYRSGKKKGKKGAADAEDEEEDTEDGSGHIAHIAGSSIMETNAKALKANAKAQADQAADDVEWGEDTSKEAQMQRRLDEVITDRSSGISW